MLVWFLAVTVRATFVEEVAYVTAYCDLPSVICPNIPRTDYCMPLYGRHFSCDDLTQEMDTHTFVGNGDAFPTELQTLSNLRGLFIASTGSGTAIMPTSLASLSRLEILSFGVTSNVISVQGTIPTDIGLLSNLKQFNILRCNFPDASIPQELGQLVGMDTFSISFTDIVTTIPQGISDWEDIELFRIFAAPGVTGSIPVLRAKNSLVDYDIRATGMTLFDDPLILFSPNIETFVLNGNEDLQGVLPLTFGNARQLGRFEVVRSPLSGSIPGNVNIATSLTRLRMTSLPNVAGTFPEVLSLLTNLDTLILSETGMTGDLPDIFFRMSSLRVLELQGNSPRDCTGAVKSSFEGTVPQTLIDLFEDGALFQLTIRDTCISGTIPESDVDLTGSLVDLTENDFVDPLPDWIIEGMEATPANVIRLAGNNFCFKPKPLTVDFAFSCCSFEITGIIDECGVCEGDNSACADCAGVPAGPAVYDACDVCGGNNACTDCLGVPFGTSTVDVCGVCGGSSDCFDCTGQLGGSIAYDRCGVCGGDGTSCLDCTGIVFGSFAVDACGVCGGNSACVDCGGVVAGPKRFDACGVCVDPSDTTYMPTCYDCTGMPNGTEVRDLCGNCPASDDCDIRAKILPIVVWRCSRMVLFASTIITLVALGTCFVFCATKKKKPRY